jgi:transforming growth factor-beta-induced protein
MSRILMVVGSCIALASAAAWSPDCPMSGDAAASRPVANAGSLGPVEVAGSDIVDTAVKAGSFKTLVAAVQAAGLVEALKGDGPFTVFAPTDAAFAALPTGTVENLLKPENRATLQSILTFHVVAGDLGSADVIRRSGATTLNGQRLTFAADSHGVAVEGAPISRADIECSNGVIHVIDRVIMPSGDNLAALAESAGMFNTLLAAAKAAGLADALTGAGPLTVFAPTDEAFAALPAGTVESLLKPENKATLAAILKYHIVSGRVYAADAVKAGEAATLQGGRVALDIRDGRLTVDGANVIKTDIDASNGVVHVIDRVILPPNG